MGRKDSDYFLNLQEEIEKNTFFNQMFGYVGEYGYLCTLIFLLQNCMFLLSIWINWLNLQIGVGNTIIF